MLTDNRDLQLDADDAGLPCPVCGLVTKDGAEEEVALFIYGVHTPSNNHLVLRDDRPVIAHRWCITAFLDTMFEECAEFEPTACIRDPHLDADDSGLPCPVCRLVARDGIDEQVALFSYGVYTPSNNKRMSKSGPMVLHRGCVTAFLDKMFDDCANFDPANN